MDSVLLLHGSGPGSTGAAWNPLVDALGERFQVHAPDLPGFGAAPPADISAWAELLAPDAPCAIVGNSAGGALALTLAVRRPDLVTRIVAVGSMGYPMPLPAGLDALWSTGPTAPEARALLDLLFHDPPGDEAVEARLAAMRAQPHYRELFPAPRQRWVDALSLTPGELASITAPVLLIHGANDRIVPPEHSVIPLLQTLPNAQAHIFGRCGHASPLEYTTDFNRLVLDFLELPQ
jgi:pimeloyl-ACP methyl ester carboxylesterase